MMRLMWKDSPVCDLDPFTPIDVTLLPFTLTERNVLNFLSERQMVPNRKHIREIYAACAISDHSAEGLLTVCNAVSVTDCYWIKYVDSESWDQVKLYDKQFSTEIANTALSGQSSETLARIATAEPNLKGANAKCVARINGELYLKKQMSAQQYKAELRASTLLDELKIPHARYTLQADRDGVRYTLCRLFTDEEHELIHYRTLMSVCNETQMGVNTYTFKAFYGIDPIRTLQMIIFDCITHNIDRNRDNLGLLVHGGKIIGHAPLYDHDGCFRATDNGHYYLTNMTFAKSLEWARTQPYWEEASKPFTECELLTTETNEAFLALLKGLRDTRDVSYLCGLEAIKDLHSIPNTMAMMRQAGICETPTLSYRDVAQLLIQSNKE